MHKPHSPFLIVIVPIRQIGAMVFMLGPHRPASTLLTIGDSSTEEVAGWSPAFSYVLFQYLH